MRRYTVRIRGNENRVENYTDREEAYEVAKRWRTLYDGAITVTDNTTRKVEVI